MAALMARPYAPGTGHRLVIAVPCTRCSHPVVNEQPWIGEGPMVWHLACAPESLQKYHAEHLEVSSPHTD